MWSWRTAVLAIVIAALVGLSGCIGPGAAEELAPPKVIREPVATPESVPTPAPTGDAPTGTDPKTPQPNATPKKEPPAARLVASAKKGLAPFTVTFQLFGEPPQGRGLTWVFDADGDGTSDLHGEGPDLAQNVTWTYAAGTWAPLLRVTDGYAVNESAVTIEAVAPPPTGAPPPVRMNGTITGVWVQEYGYVPGHASHTFALDRPVTRITVWLHFDLPAVDLDMELYGPDGDLVGRAVHYNEPTGELPPPFQGPREQTIVVTGPAARQVGTWTVRVLPALAVEADYIVDVVFA